MKEHLCPVEKALIAYEGSCNWCGESEGSMTQDIIALAREAGFFVKDNDAYSPSVQADHELTPFLVAFANLVAAKEREACKALAKEYAAEYKEGGRLYPMLNGSITKTAATACDHIVYIIGKRGQANLFGPV